MNSKEETNYVVSIILNIIMLIMIIIGCTQISKYKKIASIESDIIRCYHDYPNDDIYKTAQDFLEVIGEDTISIGNYNYCY